MKIVCVPTAVLLREAEDPDAIAAKAFWRMTFPDHPYGRPVSGTPESVAAIAIEDLRRAVGLTFLRKHLVLAVVGDITPAELGPLLDRTFGALPFEAERPVVPPAPSAYGGTAVIDREVPQSTVSFGQPGILLRGIDIGCGTSWITEVGSRRARDSVSVARRL